MSLRYKLIIRYCDGNQSSGWRSGDFALWSYLCYSRILWPWTNHFPVRHRQTFLSPLAMVELKWSAKLFWALYFSGPFSVKRQTSISKHPKQYEQPGTNEKQPYFNKGSYSRAKLVIGKKSGSLLYKERESNVKQAISNDCLILKHPHSKLELTYFVVEEESSDQGTGIFHWLVGISSSDVESSEWVLCNLEKGLYYFEILFHLWNDNKAGSWSCCKIKSSMNTCESIVWTKAVT